MTTNRKQRRAAGETRDEGAATIRPTVRRLFAEAAQHHGAGRLPEAIEAYRKAIRLQPEIPGAHVNLGNAAREIGRLDEAKASYRRAIALKPDLAEAHYNLGSVLRMRGERDAAVEAYRQAIALKPNLIEAHCNLGNVLQELGREDEAAASYRAGLALAPSDPEILNNLANATKSLGRLDEAVELYRQALAVKPDFAEALGNLTHTRKLLCDWPGLATDEEKCRATVRSGKTGISPLVFLTLPSTPAEQLACARLEAGANVVRGLPARGPQPRQRLRLAYLSGEFREHNVAYLTAELFECHDRAGFDVNAYSVGRNDGSALRRRLFETFDRFVDIRALSHAEAAARIRDDGIDILVDLMGYTASARPSILACRPAPIQVSFLGYLGTMGAAFIDYIIADRIALPMTDQPFYDERIVHLPDCCRPCDTRRTFADKRRSRSDYGLPDNGLVFCSFSHGDKIAAPFFDVWMRLLRSVPGSVLWLMDRLPWTRDNLRREAEARGIAADRLVFAPRVQPAEQLARYRLVDLVLDTLPANAETTTDALLGGAPVLTCAGNTFAGRIGASLLHAINVRDLVTSSLQEYEALALRLAADPALLGDLRRRLEANRVSAPLYDTARFSRNLEAAYRRMWDLWSQGKPPEAFTVAP